MDQQLLELYSEFRKLNSSFDVLVGQVANQQLFINGVLESINMQINAINQNTQAVATLHSKVSDIEITNSSIEDSMQEILQSNSSVISEMQELKQSVEAIKFYSFNSLVNQNM